ncbi:unnamed protein product, partial [Pylaiella littoralis]
VVTKFVINSSHERTPSNKAPTEPQSGDASRTSPNLHADCGRSTTYVHAIHDAAAPPTNGTNKHRKHKGNYSELIVHTQ